MRLFHKIPKKPLVSATSCIFKHVFKRVFLDLGGFFFHLILDCFFSCIEFILPKKKIYSIYFYLLPCFVSIFLYIYTLSPQYIYFHTWQHASKCNSSIPQYSKSSENAITHISSTTWSFPVL